MFLTNPVSESQNTMQAMFYVTGRTYAKSPEKLIYLIERNLINIHFERNSIRFRKTPFRITRR